MLLLLRRRTCITQLEDELAVATSTVSKGVEVYVHSTGGLLPPFGLCINGASLTSRLPTRVISETPRTD